MHTACVRARPPRARVGSSGMVPLDVVVSESHEASHRSSRDIIGSAPAVSATEAPGAFGVAVGSLVVQVQHTQRILRALNEMQWRKPKSRAKPHKEGYLSIAVSPEAARMLNANASAPTSMPHDLKAMLLDGSATWCPGMRAGLAESAADRGDARGGRIVPAPLAPGQAPAPAPAPVPVLVPVQMPVPVPVACARGRDGTAAESVATSDSTPSTFRYVELFAGIGGFRLALDALGGRCCLASEIDAAAAATYALNFGGPVAGDITEVPDSEIPSHDLLTGGFPCQPFSQGGLQQGLGDPRGGLFMEIIRVVRARQPAALLLENVPNLLRVDGGHAMHTIVTSLTSAGYHVRVQVINAAAVLPQARERLFFACFRDARAALAFSWPQFPSRRVEGLRSVSEILQHLSPEELATYRLTPAQWSSVRASRSYIDEPQWRLSQLNHEARTLRSSYRTGYSRFSEFVPVAPIEGGVAVARAVAEAAAARGSVAKSKAAAAAITAAAAAAAAVELAAEPAEAESAAPTSVGVPTPASELEAAAASVLPSAVPPAPRFYTERECARLMGFPSDYTLEGGKLYHQLGNAVCPPVVHAVAKCILQAIGKLPTLPATPTPGSTGRDTDENQGQDLRSCESFLTAATVNVLRSVTAPHNHLEVEACERGEWPEGYASYRSESPAQRLLSVVARPKDALFCRECQSTYQLRASVCTECS